MLSAKRSREFGVSNLKIRVDLSERNSEEVQRGEKKGTTSLAPRPAAHPKSCHH